MFNEWISMFNYGTLMFKVANGTWGTVCKHGFDDYRAAHVACRQLGYYGGHVSTW